MGKHAGGVVEWWAPAGPVDLLCLGPNDLFGGSIVVCNNLETQRNTLIKMDENGESIVILIFNVISH